MGTEKSLLFHPEKRKDCFQGAHYSKPVKYRMPCTGLKTKTNISITEQEK